MGATVVGCRWDRDTRRWTIDYENVEGHRNSLVVEHLISSAPIRELVRSITPTMSDAARSAAAALRYRDFLTVVLILKDRRAVDDIGFTSTIRESASVACKTSNLVTGDGARSDDGCYGLEYFCFEGDGLWNAPDSELIELGRTRAGDHRPGGAGRRRGWVRRPSAKSISRLRRRLRLHVGTIRAEIANAYPNLHLVGRNGMHKYNNQDHAMMTAILTARNIMANEPRYDVWRVNEDAEYRDWGGGSTGGRERSPSRSDSPE